jgi:gas vesicle protein
MRSEKRLSGILAGIVSGALFVLLFTRIKAWKSRKRLLKKIDAFAEPFEERFNQLIDSITVKFDDLKEALSGFFEKKKVTSVEIDRTIRMGSK